MVQGFHFVGEKLRDGRSIPPDGVWLEHIGVVKMCESGLHASIHPFDALTYAPGNTLCMVELDEATIQTGTDKVVSARRRIVRRINAEPLLRLFARNCALSVIHLWKAPPVVLKYLNTGNEHLREAAYAAANAANAAANAANAAAYAAAYAAANDAAAYAAAKAAKAAANAAYAAANAAYAAANAANAAAYAAAYAAANTAAAYAAAKAANAAANAANAANAAANDAAAYAAYAVNRDEFYALVKVAFGLSV